jgi:hypothetical protein
MPRRAPSAEKLKASRRADIEILSASLACTLFLCVLNAIWLRDGWRKVWRPYRQYQEARCRVIGKSVERKGLFFPVLRLNVVSEDMAVTAGSLWGEGMSKEAAQEALDKTPEDRDLPCWYPPGRPAEAVLDRRPDIGWLLFGLLFLPMNLLFAWVTALGVREWLLSARRGSS